MGDIHKHLPKEIYKELRKYLPENGGRFRIPPEGSPHDPFYREDRDKRICEMRMKGYTINEIAENFELAKITIHRILKANGLITKKSRIEKAEQIKIMLNMGMSKKKIAEKLGISREWVYQIMKKEGL
jgi:hypothetical protein